MLRRIVGLLILLSIVGLSSCGSKTALTVPSAVSIDLSLPANTTLLPGQSAQFSASVSNASNTTVIWEVNNIVGGNGQVGIITTGGLYTAPSTFPSGAIRSRANVASSSTTVTITAAAAANTSANANATVTLLPAATVSLSPLGPSVFLSATLQFTATVTNSTNTAVTWQVNGVTGGNSTTGTISASGLYTAPAALPTPSTVTVTAVSAADSASTASTTVSIQALPPVVTVSPSNVSVPGNTTQQFTATVTNTANHAVTWEVNNIPGGNATVGIISQTGLYTGPSAIPNPATVTVSAVSAANTSSVGSASVTVTTPEVVTVTPSSVTIQPYATQQFTGTSSIASDTLTWQVNGVTGGDSTYGTITSAGLYTAPSAAPANPVVVIKAVSTVNPAIFGSAVVSIGTTAPSVTVSPQGTSAAINTTVQFSASVLPSNLSQAVQWQVDSIPGGSSTVGTISSTGLYTAPLVVPNPAAVTISAVSSAVPSVFGSSTLTVTLPTTPISVTVNPPTASVIVGQSQAFTAAVTPNNNTAVTWTILSVQFSCAESASNACGSIDTSGNYTAPMSIPGGGQSANVTVKATSKADPTKSGTATVTINPVPTPTLSINATSTAVCSTLSTSGCSPTTDPTFTVTATNFPGNATLQFNWTLSCINGDDADGDQCGDNDGDPAPTIDGPGQIQATGGGAAGSTVTNSNSIQYLPPQKVFSNPVIPAPNQCPAPGSSTTQLWAYVSLTVSTVYNSTTYTSPPVCVQVIWQF
jgi:hypothetical protein